MGNMAGPPRLLLLPLLLALAHGLPGALAAQGKSFPDPPWPQLRSSPCPVSSAPPTWATAQPPGSGWGAEWPPVSGDSFKRRTKGGPRWGVAGTVQAGPLLWEEEASRCLSTTPLLVPRSAPRPDRHRVCGNMSSLGCPGAPLSPALSPAGRTFSVLLARLVVTAQVLPRGAAVSPLHDCPRGRLRQHHLLHQRGPAWDLPEAARATAPKHHLLRGRGGAHYGQTVPGPH